MIDEFLYRAAHEVTDVRDGAWVYYMHVHDNLFADPPMHEAIKQQAREMVVEGAGCEPEEVLVFSFSSRYLQMLKDRTPWWSWSSFVVETNAKVTYGGVFAIRPAPPLASFPHLQGAPS